MDERVRHVKLAYGTYGMKQLDIFEVLPRLKQIGYDAVEITVASGWSTDSARMDTDTRKRIVDRMRELDMPSPVLLDIFSPCITGEARKEMLIRFDQFCRLARDLKFDDGPAIVTGTLGGVQPDWETGKSFIADCLIELAEIANGYNVVIAAEPHIGGAWDTPEKAVWMMEATRHPNLKLNFDISHFAVQGMDIAHCVKLCVPHAVHCHVKDGRIHEGKVQFLLPGEAGFDYRAYFALLHQAGLSCPVTVEVSGMVWNREDYDPWVAAELCWRTLDHARPEVEGRQSK